MATTCCNLQGSFDYQFPNSLIPQYPNSFICFVLRASDFGFADGGTTEDVGP
jgi:hypothetical protein